MLPVMSSVNAEDRYFFLWGTVGLFSFWGGVVRYLVDRRNGRRKGSWREGISQIVISGFTGFLGGFYGYEQYHSEFMTLVIACVSSSLGGNLLSQVWQRFIHNKGGK